MTDLQALRSLPARLQLASFFRAFGARMRLQSHYFKMINCLAERH